MKKVILLLLASWFCLTGMAQLTLIENPNPTQHQFSTSGYQGNVYNFNGKMMVDYRDDNSVKTLYEFDGTNLFIIPNPPNHSNANRGFIGPMIEYGGWLYAGYINNSGIPTIYKYDGVNTILTQVIPPAGTLFLGCFAKYNGKLYMGFRNASSVEEMWEFDGTNFTLIPNPPNHNNAFRGYSRNAYEWNGKLYCQYVNNSGLAQCYVYDGSTLTLIPNPPLHTATNRGYTGSALAFNGKLYLSYNNDSGLRQMYEYDGSNLTLVPNPPNHTATNTGYYGSPYVFNSKLYLRYFNNSSLYQLYAYDGTTTTLVPSPPLHTATNFGYMGDPMEYNGKLYLRYRNNAGLMQMYEYDGTSHTLISNPPTPLHTANGAGYYSSPNGYNTKLYLRYMEDTGRLKLWQFGPTCANPSIPTLTSSAGTALCNGGNTTLSISSGSLNGGTQWNWYTGSCGGTLIGTGTSINVNPAVTTTYYVRGEGGCVVGGSCSSITIGVYTMPGALSSISGSITPCQSSVQSYSVTSNSNIQSYTWTLPGGWSGSSVSNAIGATVGAASGTISVIGNNVCGSTTPQTLATTVTNIPAIPGTVTGNNAVCATSIQSYSVAAVSGATSYNWTLPGGWSGTSTANSINATVGASSGNVTVTANNSCGSSAAQTLAVAVSPVPSTPGSISGSVTACSSSSQIYSVSPVGGATSYTWNLPVGWTGSSTTNSINVTAGAAGGNITVTANNACGNSSAQTLAVNISNIPSVPGSITGNPTVCATSAQSYSIAAVSGATSYTWILPGGWSGTSTTNNINTTAGVSSGNISVTANNSCGSSAAQLLSVTVSPVPSAPGSVTGNTTICSSSLQTYSVAAVGGATSYTWTLPGGWSGSSITNSINATSGASGGNITVTANNACGSSPAQTLAVTVNSSPATPASVSGSAAICSSSSQSYSVTNVSGATSYTWTLPGGWSGTSTTNSISATAGATGGNITVTANNTCGNSIPQSLAVVVNSAPSAPGSISGNTAVCSTSPQTYSVTAVGGATSYTWVLPGGWSGTSTTNSINTTVGASSGNITITANNTCGSSSAETLPVTVSPVPFTPGSISGNISICPSSSQTYSVAAVGGATSYTWTLPGGWSGSSTTNSINTTSGASSGNITVTANNACGSSPAQTLGVTVGNTPAVPGSISGLAAVCSSSSQTYSVSAVAGATSYTWTLPSGWSGTSATNLINANAGITGGTISVTANNGCGNSTAQTMSVSVNAAPATPGSIIGNATICSGSSNAYSISAVAGATSYTWTLPGGWAGTSTTTSISTTAGSAGSITVTANNTCGSSAAQTLAVLINNTPVTPGSISGNNALCSGTSQTYSVTSVPGATSYLWTLPGGWSGTSTTNSINAIAGSAGGNVSVIANNACGSSAAQSINISVSSTPAQPSTVSGSTSVCSGASETYAVVNDPGASGYTWILPAGWMGSSSSNIINTTTASSGGNIIVTANNSCGSSPSQTLTITSNTLPVTPGSIAGNATVCSATSQTYSVTAVAGATSYTWVLPGGWSGTSTTNSISVTAGTLGGNITVTSNNSCGSSAAQLLAVTVDSSPSMPGAITGNTTVCSGSSQTYSVPSESGVTSYTWVIPGSWTGTSTTNSISATAGITGGNVLVTANNGCGSSFAQSLAVTALTVPATPSVISGGATVCSSSTQVYSVVNDPQAASYTWSLPAGWGGASNTSNITTTAGSTGGAISVEATNACGTSSAQILTISVTTTPSIPSVITGNTVVCSGNSETYAVVNDPAATSYTWSLPATWTGTSTSNSINSTTGTGGGNITVTANNTCGVSPTQTLVVSLGSLPPTPASISGNIAVCSGSTNLYSIAPVAGATSYTWTLPSGWSGTSTINSINATAGTLGGTIFVTANNGCGNSPAQSLVVTINTPATPVISKVGNTLTCNPAFTTYQWYVNGSLIAGATSQSHTATISGHYTVVVTDANGCSVRSAAFSLKYNGLNEEAGFFAEVRIFPNPTNGLITVSGMKNCSECSLVIYSAVGETVYQATIAQSETTIDLSNSTPGIYFMHLKNENISVVQKIIKH